MKTIDLIALPPDERVTRTFRRLIPLAQGERYARLPLEARHVFVLAEWLGETHNGGVRQYFTNASGNRWSDARFAFDVVGAGGDTFARALAVFAGGAPPSHPSARARAANEDGIGASLDALDAAIDRDALIDAVARSIVQHRDVLSFIDRYPSGLKALDVDDDPDAFAAFVAEADVADVDSAFTVITWAAFLWRPLAVSSSAEPKPGAHQLQMIRFLHAFDVLDEASVDGISGYKRTHGANVSVAQSALEEAGAVVLAAALRDDDDAAVQGARIATAVALARVVKAMVAAQARVD